MSALNDGPRGNGAGNVYRGSSAGRCGDVGEKIPKNGWVSGVLAMKSETSEASRSVWYPVWWTHVPSSLIQGSTIV